MKPTLGHGITIDVPRIVETRTLVQSNSGGGKSRTIRRVLEQTFGFVQQIVLDSEGEFSTLREKFDYIICAPHDADAVARPQTAALLARRLLELNASAIVDISDLKAHERQRFIKLFIESMMNAPKKLWHPVIVVIDEAHIYCPEKGSAESTGAIIDLCTRGRKRGFSALLATQRLAKLHKDAAAELLNVMIGRTGLDVDVKRVADILGMTAKGAMATLRHLKPGEFYVFGPALSMTVEKVKVGSVRTIHPEAGQRTATVQPAASSKIKKVLAELADLQEEAETEAKSIADLKKDNANLRRDLTLAKKQGGGISDKEVERKVQAAVRDIEGKYQKELVSASKKADLADSVLNEIAQRIGRYKGHIGNMQICKKPTKNLHIKSLDPKPEPKYNTKDNTSRPVNSEVAEGVTRPQQKILDALAKMESLGLEKVHKASVAAFAGVSPTSGAYGNNLGRLRTVGYIDYPEPSHVSLTDEGRSAANHPDRPATLEDVHESWLSVVTRPQSVILKELIAIHPKSISKNDLADRIGVSATSGAYGNNLGRLRTLGAITYPSQGHTRATDILFPGILSG